MDYTISEFTHLTFGWNFNRSLNQYSIPVNIRRLTFGHDFNQPLDQHSIPVNVRRLTFGCDFNQQFLLAKTISFVL